KSRPTSTRSCGNRRRARRRLRKTNSSPGRSCSGRPPGRWTRATSPNGGTGRRGPAGVTRKAQTALSTGKTIIPSSPSRRPKPTRTRRGAARRRPPGAEGESPPRGGREKKGDAGGAEPFSEARPQCNIWQGEFPHRNTVKDGYERTAPVKSFPPNGYGLYDM